MHLARVQRLGASAAVAILTVSAAGAANAMDPLWANRLEAASVMEGFMANIGAPKTKPTPFGNGTNVNAVVDYARSLRRNRFSRIPRAADADESGYVYTTDSGIPTTSGGVVIGSGTKVHTDVDFSSEGQMPLTLSRTYNKSLLPAGAFGQKWFSTLDYRLAEVWQTGPCIPEPGVPPPPNCNPVGEIPGTLMVFRANGARYSYMWDGTSRWVDDLADPVSKIEKLPTHYVLHTSADGEETYSFDGLVLSVRDKHGVGWTFEYAPLNPTLVTTVRHSSGRTIQLQWENNKVKYAWDPANQRYEYTYNANGHLSGVIYPTPGETRTYHYELSAPQLKHALTGISVNGVRYATFSYYPDVNPGLKPEGYVSATELAGGLNRTTFTYSPDDGWPGTDEPLWAEVTNAKGATQRYEFDWVPTGVGRPGRKVLRRVTGLNVANADPSTPKEIVYDPTTGTPDYQVDWDGNVTDFTFKLEGPVAQPDLGHCRREAELQPGVGTGSQRHRS